MSDQSLQQVMSGAAWDAFCDSLKSAGATILGDETPASAPDRAEGFRYLSRLTRLSLEMMLEFADPDFPVFYAASHDTIKVFAPNPDTLYPGANPQGGAARGKRIDPSPDPRGASDNGSSRPAGARR
jgi:hypothetical protein